MTQIVLAVQAPRVYSVNKYAEALPFPLYVLVCAFVHIVPTSLFCVCICA
jgi:hypothetical protein